MRPFISLPVRVPSLLKWWYPSWYVWDRKNEEKVIYLTFDDGPIPEITEWVLDTLQRVSRPNEAPIKASFFCIGDNVQKHPKIFQRILSEGHQAGNHTFHHLKGWQTDTVEYIENTLKAAHTMEQHALDVRTENELQFPLFRPPYGKIKKSQAQKLRALGYQIIMYRVVAYDWEATVTPEKCLANVINNTKSGDLVVFHDSIKAFKNVQYALPRVIAHFQEKGYRFETL
jgi:peptidoglycan/xylan/chitin deacetylase (PgdA/CDA1 family)